MVQEYFLIVQINEWFGHGLKIIYIESQSLKVSKPLNESHYRPLGKNRFIADDIVTQVVYSTRKISLSMLNEETLKPFTVVINLHFP